MTLVRLEHKNFEAADDLAAILTERQLDVTSADAEGPADQRSTIYVCSAAHEASLGGTSTSTNVRGVRLLLARVQCQQSQCRRGWWYALRTKYSLQV